MFDRYLDNPKATEESFLADPTTGESWFKTGDCALRSSQFHGSYKILGRFSQDIIKKAGYKISALEIEGTLVQHEYVRECAVIGVPNEEFGEELVAYVVLNDKVNASESQASQTLKDYCREKMSYYKVPRVWKFIDEVPRNPMNKVSKVALKEKYHNEAGN